ALPVSSTYPSFLFYYSGHHRAPHSFPTRRSSDLSKSDETVRGSVVLPAGTGKKVRIAVFAQGDKAKAAKDAGADIVGMEDLAESIKGGKIDFDVVIASPDTMRVVGALGQILGPRGLMPN